MYKRNVRGIEVCSSWLVFNKIRLAVFTERLTFLSVLFLYELKYYMHVFYLCRVLLICNLFLFALWEAPWRIMLTCLVVRLGIFVFCEFIDRVLCWKTLAIIFIHFLWSLLFPNGLVAIFLHFNIFLLISPYCFLLWTRQCLSNTIPLQISWGNFKQVW